MKNLQKWKLLQSEMVLDNPWCKVRQDKIELPDGKIIDDFFVNIRPEIVLIVAITSDQEIVFVRQYRYGVNEILLELPGGTFDPEKESAEAAVKREIKEETGYIAKEVMKLATLYDNPVKDTNKIHLFIAENIINSGKQDLDITEEIEIVLIPVESVLDKIIQGEISVAGSVAGLFLGLNFIKQPTLQNRPLA